MPDFVENYLGYLLARCSYQVSASFHEQLKDQGIGVLSWRVLCSIRTSAHTVNQLAAKALVNQSTLSKALDRMEKDDLITRQRDPAYRSKTNINITEKGKRLIDQLIDTANRHEKDSVAHMSDSELQQLRRLLQRLIQH